MTRLANTHVQNAALQWCLVPRKIIENAFQQESDFNRKYIIVVGILDQHIIKSFQDIRIWFAEKRNEEMRESESTKDFQFSFGGFPLKVF